MNGMGKKQIDDRRMGSFRGRPHRVGVGVNRSTKCRSIGGASCEILLPCIDRGDCRPELLEAAHVRVRQQAPVVRREAGHQLRTATHRISPYLSNAASAKTKAFG